MAEKGDITGIFAKLGKKGSIGATLLIGIMLIAPFASAAKGGIISGTIYNSNSYTLGQVKVELYNYVNVDTLSTAISLQSNSLVETERTWNCTAPKFTQPIGIPSSSPIFSDTTPTNTKPPGLGVSNTRQNDNATDTNTPPTDTASSTAQINDSVATNAPPSGSADISPQNANTTATNVAPSGSTASISPQISNATATNTSPLGTTASITSQSSDTNATDTKPIGLSDPTNQTNNATAAFSPPSGTFTISPNSEDASSTTSQPNGAPGSKSGTWYTGSFVLEGGDDGDGSADDTIYWVLTDNETAGDYDIMNLSYEDSSNYADGNTSDQYVGPGDDEGIFDGEVVTLGTYNFTVNFSSVPATASPDAWISSNEWYTGSFNIDLNGDGIVGGSEIFYYSLADNNSDGMYDYMDLSTDDTVFGEGDLWDGNTTTDNDELIGIGGANVRLETYFFVVDFVENPNSSDQDAFIQSKEWYNGSFKIDADDDGLVDDRIYFALSDMNSDGVYDTMDLSLDTTYGQGNLNDDNVNTSSDEQTTTDDFLTLGNSFEFLVSFDASPTPDTDDARIKSNEWYKGTFTIDGNGDGVVEADNVHYVLTDTDSDGIYEAMDISIGDQVYGEGNVGNSLVNFSGTNNADDERITLSTNITLGEHYLFTVEFDGDPNLDGDDAGITSKEWYEGTFIIDADADASSDDDIYFVLSDTDSEGLYEAMDISIGDTTYGEGNISDSIVDFDVANNTNDERIATPTIVLLGAYYSFQISFDDSPNLNANDAELLSYTWYEGSFLIDADNDGFADDDVYFALSDTNSNGTYDIMDISIEDQVYGETGSGTLSDGVVNYLSLNNNDDDEQVTWVSPVRLGDSLLFIVYFDSTPPSGGNDALILIYEWYHGSFEIDADDVDDDGLKDDDVYYILTDTDSNGLYDTMDISINDIIFGETGGGGLSDGIVDYVTDNNNLDDERITTSSDIILSDSLLFAVEFDNNPDNADLNDARILSIEWYTGSFSIDIDGDGIVDPSGMNFALMDTWSRGLYIPYMEISTDDATYGEGNLSDQRTEVDNDEIIFGSAGEFVRLGAYTYHVRSYDGLNDGLDVNDGVNYDTRDAKITISQWFTGSALLEGNTRNAIVADSDSDGIFDEIYIDVNDDGDFGDMGTDAIAVSVSGTFQGNLLELQYTVVSIDPTGQYFEIMPTGAGVGSTASWFVGQIEVPLLSGDMYDVVIGDTDGDALFETADFDTNLPGDSIMDVIGLSEISGTVDLGGIYYQVVSIEDSGAFVRINSYLDAILNSTNDISLTNTIHYGIVAESVLTLNLNQDEDATDIYQTIVVDNAIAGVYESVFIDTDDDGYLYDELLLGRGDVFYMVTPPPFEPHKFDIDFIASSGDHYAFKQNDPPVDTYLTNADGSYTLNAPTDGDYWIKVTNSTTSWGYATLYDTNSNTGINLVNGIVREDWDEYLTQTGNFIFGFVNDSFTNEPIEGCIVEIYDPVGKLVAGTMTKTDGTYQIAVEQGGVYDMVYRLKGYYTDDGRTTGTWQNLLLLGDSCSIDVLLVPDTTPPSIVLDHPSEGQTIGGTVDVKATATDDFLLYIVEVSFDYGATYHAMTSAGGNTYTYSWDTTTYSEGIHRVMVKATDHGGYTDTDFNDVYVSNDGTSPTVSIASPVNLEYVEGVHVIQVHATDNYALQFVNLTLGGTTYPMAYNPGSGYYEFLINTTPFTDELHSLSAEAKDYAGNSAVYSLMNGFYIDNNAPTLSIYSPLNGEMVSGTTVFIDLDSIDAGPFVPTVQYKIDNGAWTTLSGSELLGWADTWDSTTVSNGIHTITFRSYDDIGHFVTESVTITVDNDNPTAAIVTPVENECVQGIYTFKVSASDDVDVTNVYVTINGIDYIAGYNSAGGLWEVAIDTSTTPDGTYGITTTVEDGIPGHAQTTTSFNFNIDNNAPTLFINSPLDGARVYGSTVSIDVDSTDEGAFVPEVQYRIDSGAWVTLTGSEALGWTDSWDSTSVSNGIHTITFRAYDDIGHLITKSITIIVDNDTPTVSIAAPVENEYVQGTYTFKVLASDDVEVTNVYVTINGKNYITGYNSASGFWEVAIDTTTISDGTYGIKATVEDGIPGHIQSTTPFNFNLDNNAPTLFINSPLNGATVYGSAMSIDADSTDEGAFVPIVRYRIDTGAWVTLTGSEALGWIGSWDSNSVSNGVHTITFRAYDDIGHVVTESVTITVDNDNPTASIVAPVVDEYVQGIYTFKVSASDDVDVTNVYITINGVDHIAGYNSAGDLWEVAIDTSTIPDGTYGITTTVEDGVPGHTQTTSSFNFNIDNNAPTLTINSPLNAATVYGSTVSIEANSIDEGTFVPTVQYRIDTGAWFTLTGSETLGWTDSWDSNFVTNGIHTITFRAYDDIDHVVTKSVTITVDNDKPTVSIAAPVMGEYVQGTYTFKVLASDDVEVTRVYITINGKNYITGYNSASGFWEVAIDTTTISDGTYGIKATVEDGISSHTQTTTPFNFNLDNNAPTLFINSPLNGATVYGSAVSIDADSTDEGAFVPIVQYRIDSGAWITLIGSETLGWTDSWDPNSVSNGVHLLTFRAQDVIGHVITESITITVDNDDPTASVVTPIASEFVQGTYTFKVSASDDVHVTNVYITINGIDYIAGYNSASGFWEVAIDTNTIPDGSYSIKATVEDGVPGHTQTTTPFNFNIDNNAPLLIIISPLDEDHVKGSVALNITGSDTFIDRVEYSVDGTGWVTNTTIWDTTFLTDGSHTLTIRAVDLAGHVTQEAIIVVVDNTDTDDDGVGDLADPDIDGDGVINSEDSFPYDATEWADTDNDGIGDNADTDDDGDGVPDTDDDFPLNPNEWLDVDGDGVGNNADTDDDNDGIPDQNDAFPHDATEWSDIDADEIGNNVDTDDDGDGVLDAIDDFPLNPNEYSDTDGDGIGDNFDLDIDGDGVYNINDAFPYNASESSDMDGDGVGDLTDPDIDGDGVPNNFDWFRENPYGWRDTDSDGIHDNADMDDDGDLVPDINDAFPLDANEWRDIDGDGEGDNHDDDIDGDGVSNDDDEFPYNINEWRDTDNDGLGDIADADDDNDGVVDQEDYYPLDKSRYLEPFWWWWILIAMLIVTLIFVIYITQKEPPDILGDEEEYMETQNETLEEPVKEEYEKILEKDREPVLGGEEETKIYSEDELKSMRKNKLIKIAEGMALSTHGTKLAIINRIKEAQIEKVLEEEEKAEEEAEEGREEEIECPSCGNSFMVKIKESPTVVKCPHCSTSGTID